MAISRTILSNPNTMKFIFVYHKGKFSSGKVNEWKTFNNYANDCTVINNNTNYANDCTGIYINIKSANSINIKSSDNDITYSDPC